MFSLVAACSFILVKGQPNNQKIQSRKLTVNDYKGAIENNVDFMAMTYTVVVFQYSNPEACSEKGKVRCRVETKVSLSDKSWMKVNRIRSKEVLNELLSHEQGHYDLSVVFARDLQNTLAAKCFYRETYRTQADSIFQSMKKHYDSLQRRYDLETRNMQNREMQVKWKQRIERMMREE
jgi:predicted secreted Zn-dependent protease